MKIYDKEKVKRKLPVNLKEDDRYLFSREFEKEFSEVISKRVDDVYMLSNGYCYKNGILYDLLSSSGYTIKYKIRLIIKAFFVFSKSKKTIKIKQGILITDAASSLFFHWFGDVLQKLEAMESASVNVDDYVFLLPEYCMSNYVLQTLKLYGIKYKVIERELVHVQHLLVVPKITPTGNYRASMMMKIRKRFQNYYKVQLKNTRVFITRKKAPKRIIVNEEALYPILEEYGFTIVAMEDLSFEEQYKVVAESNFLVSLHGAGLTHMLWMKEFSKVLEIRLKDDSHYNCYFSLASDLNLQYYYTLADKTNEKSTEYTDFVVDINAFKDTLERMIKG